MNADVDQSDNDLRSTLSRAHDQTDALLADPAGNRLEVVTWMSAHIAAFEHAIYPAVKRRVPDGSALVGRDREIAARIARTLRMLDRHHSGDVLATGLSAVRLNERISAQVAEHRKILGRILDALERSLDHSELDDLARSYRKALAQA